MIPEVDARILQIFDEVTRLGMPVLTSSGEPFEWKEHIFLLEPLCDFHPSQGVNKCAQVGFSETNILKAFYAAKILKLNILYTLPTDDFLQDFVKPKVNKIIDNNPALYSDVSGGIYQKQVGRDKNSRFIYFQGAYNPEAESKREQTSRGTSITSDLNIHDEASKSDQFILAQMMSRYQNSRYKGRWLFDNPTYPKMGADVVWQASDQKHWIIKCSRCGYRQYLDWHRLDKEEFKAGSNHTWVDPIKKEILCGKCQKPISDYDRLTGEWVKKRSSITEHRGYWINQLMYVRHTVKSIMDVEENPKMPTSNFHNMVLGKPYIGSDVKISRSNIAANISLDVNPLTDNVMGIDQGKWKHYVVGNARGIFLIGKTQSWDELEMIWTKYNATVVCDALPSQYEPKMYAAKMNARFYRAFYKPESDQSEIAKFIDEVDDHRVLIRRHEAFDEIVNRILSGSFPLQVNINDIQEYVDHWTAMVRVVSADKEGNQRFQWVETDADHYAHASLYFDIGLIKAGAGKTTVSMKPRQKTPQDELKVDSIVVKEGAALPDETIRKLLRVKK